MRQRGDWIPYLADKMRKVGSDFCIVLMPTFLNNLSYREPGTNYQFPTREVYDIFRKPAPFSSQLRSHDWCENFRLGTRKSVRMRNDLALGLDSPMMI
jgi:hypothetical protein